MKSKYRILVTSLALLFAGTFYACSDKNEDPINNKPDVEFLILSTNNQLTAYNASDVRTPIRPTVTITGLQTSETIVAIDYRPATGQLYGIGSTSRLYIINVVPGSTSAVATLVGTGPINPVLSGPIVGFDFNPTVDRIRVVSSTGQNLRINPETAAVTIDGNINGVTSPEISSAAYTNNFSGATTTTLYNIDVVAQKLYKQDPPNNGTLVEVGSLGLPDVTSGNSSFDISQNGIALAVIKNGASGALYQINLETGKASPLGTISSSSTSTTLYSGIAILPRPVAYAVNTNNELMAFDPTNTTTNAVITKPVTGLDQGENILGIDFRPSNAQLYALGSNSNIYTLNTATGAATKINTLPLVPALSGDNFGFDFNPSADLIRIVSNTGQNLRVSPVTGLVTNIDPAISPSTSVVSAAAYSNNIPGAATTTLYVIDITGSKLFTQNATTGALTSVGAASNKLGITPVASNGFDISGTTGAAYSIFSVGTTTVTTGIYSINLSSGAATSVVSFPSGVRGFTLGLGF